MLLILIGITSQVGMYDFELFFPISPPQTNYYAMALPYMYCAKVYDVYN